MEWLERRFELRARGTTLGRELTAGCVTFLTLSYILFVQPTILGATGMDRGGVLFATCVASAVACLVMAFWANHPIALAPAMGHNVFFAFVVCGPRAMGFDWDEALAANLIAGVIFLLLAPTGLREAVMHGLPDSIRLAIAAGIGLLIARLGLVWAGLLVDDPTLLIRLGELGGPVVLLSIFGLAATGLLVVRGIRGALLVGMLLTTAAGLAAGLIEWNGLAGAPPRATTAFRLDFEGLFSRPWQAWIYVVVTFLILDLFDTAGTLTGIAERANLLRNGRLPRAREAFGADAVGTVTGALLGTSTITSYVESAAGVASGGRTGLTAAVVGLLMLASLFFAPLLGMVGAGIPSGEVLCYPVIAPALVLVGATMIGALRKIPWDEPAEAIPAFLTVTVMLFSMSITDGIAWGVMAYAVLGLARADRRPAPLVHVLALLFLARYVWAA